MANSHTIRLRGWRAWGGIAVGAGLCAVSLATAIGVFLGDHHWALIGIALGCAALFAAMVVYSAVLRHRYAVTFHEDALEVVTMFRHSRVLKADVTGWSDGNNDGAWARVVLLHLKSDPQRPIEIPLATIKDQPVLDWFESLENTEAAATARNLQSVLADETYGHTPEARGDALLRERRIAMALNWTGAAACVWIWFWPRPYVAAIVVGLLLPVLAFGLLAVFRGRWIFAADNTEVRPNLNMLCVMPLLAVFLRAILDYRIVDTPRLAMIACVFGVFGWLATCALHRISLRWSGNQVLIALTMALYGYAAATHLNMQFIRPDPRLFEVTVLESYESEGRGGLELAAWGPFDDPQQAKIPVWLQRKIPAGSRVQVLLHTGLLGARWWTVKPLPPETDS